MLTGGNLPLDHRQEQVDGAVTHRQCRLLDRRECRANHRGEWNIIKADEGVIVRHDDAAPLSLAHGPNGHQVVETSQRITSRGRRCLTLSYDLGETTPDSAARVVQECVSELGRLDILVNNTGINRRGPALSYKTGDREAVLSINPTSAFYLCQAMANHCVTAGQGGKIINMSSMMSFQGGIQVPAYTAAKSGLADLTRALANEWASQGSNVNAIAPGYMATELTADIRGDVSRGPALLGRIPAGRWGQPDDIVGAAVFLASDAASYVHGAIIPVDGGWLAR